MPEQTYDYLIAPKTSFDATADAIRTMNGTNTSIEWKQTGFAEAIGDGRRYTIDEIFSGEGLVGDVVFTGSVLRIPLAFQTVMTSFTADYVTSLPNQDSIPMFKKCTSLSNISMAKVNYIYNSTYIFQNCTSLTSITSANLPKARTFYAESGFQGCTGLTLFCIPAFGRASVRYFANSMFKDCTNLATVDMSLGNKITGTNFQNCSNLTTLILRVSSAITTLNAISSFSGTPFASGGTGGTIYIPKALYDHLGDGSNLDYKVATNWSTLDGYGTVTWAKIEGSQYEDAYADGTVINGNGVNKLQNSQHFNPDIYPYSNSNVRKDATTYDGESAYYCSGSEYIQIDFPELTRGESYTLSFDVRRSNNQNVYVQIEGSSAQSVGSTGADVWTRVSYSDFAGMETYARIQVYSTTKGEYIMAIRNIKLESGTNATAWTPAPSGGSV